MSFIITIKDISPLAACTAVCGFVLMDLTDIDLVCMYFPGIPVYSEIKPVQIQHLTGISSVNNTAIAILILILIVNMQKF